jgi:arsenate reductase
MNIVIHHNPDCGTSRNVIATVEAAGYKPTIIEYLKTGWTRPQLLALPRVRVESAHLTE